MHSTMLCLLLAGAAHGASLQQRGIVPFRAPKVEPIPDSPGSLGAGGVRPGHIGSGSSSSNAEAWAGLAAGGRGTAPESTTPFHAESNVGKKELVEKAVEVIGEVFDLLQNIVSLATGDDDEDDDDGKWRSANGSTASLPESITPKQVASTSDGASNTTANFILSQDNVTYTFLSDPRLLSQDVVAEMANSSFSRLRPYQDLFTSREYSMFLNDPLCFYANIESLYFNASSSVAAAASTTPSPTQSVQRRQASTDEPGSNTSCETLLGIPVCTAVPGSPQWTSSQAEEISSLWAHELPDQLWSAHFATPTADSGDVTATATSTTSCVGLDGGEGPVTRYRELKVRGMDAEQTSASTSSATGEVVGAGARLDGRLGLACLAGAAVVLVGAVL